MDGTPYIHSALFVHDAIFPHCMLLPVGRLATFAQDTVERREQDIVLFDWLVKIDTTDFQPRKRSNVTRPLSAIHCEKIEPGHETVGPHSIVS